MLCSHRMHLDYDWLDRTARISGERTVYFLDLANIPRNEEKRNIQPKKRARSAFLQD
jgi:hypothetical protein